MAAEMMSEKGYSGLEADVFALGVILHSMVYGTPPFLEARDQHHRSLMKKWERALKTDNLRPIDDLIHGMLE